MSNSKGVVLTWTSSNTGNMGMTGMGPIATSGAGFGMNFSATTGMHVSKEYVIAQLGRCGEGFCVFDSGSMFSFIITYYKHSEIFSWIWKIKTNEVIKDDHLREVGRYMQFEQRVAKPTLNEAFVHAYGEGIVKALNIIPEYELLQSEDLPI